MQISAVTPPCPTNTHSTSLFSCVLCPTWPTSLPPSPLPFHTSSYSLNTIPLLHLLPSSSLHRPSTIPPFHISPVIPSIHPFIHACMAGCPGFCLCYRQHHGTALAVSRRTAARVPAHKVYLSRRLLTTAFLFSLDSRKKYRVSRRKKIKGRQISLTKVHLTGRWYKTERRIWCKDVSPRKEPNEKNCERKWQKLIKLFLLESLEKCFIYIKHRPDYYFY